jgi:transposase InsO family protein
MESCAASQRKACELAHIARSSLRYRANPEKDENLRVKLTQLAHEKPRYGYRRLTILLRREGRIVNHKKVFRVYRAAGLSVKRKRRKHLVRVGQPLFTAMRPNQQWAIDFVHDRMANGRTLRVLSIVDTFTRECLALDAQSPRHASAGPCHRRTRQARADPNGQRAKSKSFFLVTAIDLLRSPKLATVRHKHLNNQRTRWSSTMIWATR